MTSARIGQLVVGLIAAVVAVAGCGGGGTPTATPTATASATPSVAPTGTAAATAIDVTLAEWSVSTSSATAKAGSVTFRVTNNGPEDVHEFVVVKTDLSLIDLPTDATGKVDEEGAGIEIMGEVEELAVGASDELTLTLQPGAYVLICNIYDESEQEAHYQEGMRNALTVQP